MNRQNILARKWSWKLGFHPTMWLPNEIMNEEFTLVLLEYYWEKRKNSNCIYNITNAQKHRAAWKPFGTMVLHGVPHVSIIGTITHLKKKKYQITGMYYASHYRSQTLQKLYITIRMITALLIFFLQNKSL